MDISPYSYREQIFDNEVRNTDCLKKKKVASSTNGVGQTEWVHVEERKIDPCLLPFINSSSRGRTLLYS